MNTTHLRRLASLLVLLAFALTLHAQPASDSVSITFKVKPPAGTPAEAKLYLAGDAQALGAWKADGVELKMNDDGTYFAVVSLPKDHPIEYKVNRGTWETVEKNADGSELSNRTFTPTRDTTVDIEVAAWADKPSAAAPPATKPKPQSTKTGDIRTHSKFHSKNLDNDRDIYVYLPPGYEQHPDQRYAVFYMHDGQNLFDNATAGMGEWKADETAQRLIQQGKIEPLIIVGISNTPQRIDEYALTRDAGHNAGGKGEAYVRFVVDEVKPFIDQTYRTKTDREHTGVGGSSLGATISLEIIHEHPDLFGRCAVISPALWWNGNDILKRFRSDSSWAKNCRFWIDIGAAEGPPEAAQVLLGSLRELGSILLNAGLVENKDFKITIVPGAQHNETAWSARFDRVLLFLFPAAI